ncbi:LTXXQ motif family protein [Devosia enhydra]|uniref:LTXXQ motif family protein n=1 Tax=Devosia enhydra TaxID=665118 RepID=A0A1K2HWB2_9HYPH|nr:Spy/CpxP family protein refolding chaperone [Devosia enhydra]SFZ82295.1 LTXXQ motif family protein [Devosia enhydra]
MTSLSFRPGRSLAALAVAAMALAAVPAVQAHDLGQGRNFDRHDQMRGDARGPDRAMRGDRRGPGMQMRGEGRADMLVSFSCAPRAAERLEVGLVRLSHRLELSGTQQPLFDAFRTSALTAQTGLADSCETLRPDPAAETAAPAADPVQSIRDRLSVESARIAAIESVLPDYEAFVTSLTPEQSALLAPPSRERVGEMRGGRGEGRGGWRQHHQGPRGRMQPAPQPPAADAPAPAPQG